MPGSDVARALDAPAAELGPLLLGLPEAQWYDCKSFKAAGIDKLGICDFCSGPLPPWAGVVRVECSANLKAAEAIALANLSQATLCRDASDEYKDSRARKTSTPSPVSSASCVTVSAMPSCCIGHFVRLRASGDQTS